MGLFVRRKWVGVVLVTGVGVPRPGVPALRVKSQGSLSHACEV